MPQRLRSATPNSSRAGCGARLLLVFCQIHVRSQVRRVCRRGLAFPSLGPEKQFVERRTEFFAAGSEAVLDLRGHYRMHDAANDAVALQVAQLLDKHLLGNPWNCPFEFAEPK